MKTPTGREEKFSTKEAQSRFEAALKGAMNTPHKPLKEKKRRAKVKKKPSPKKKSGK